MGMMNEVFREQASKLFSGNREGLEQAEIWGFAYLLNGEVRMYFPEGKDKDRAIEIVKGKK